MCMFVYSFKSLYEIEDGTATLASYIPLSIPLADCLHNAFGSYLKLISEKKESEVFFYMGVFQLCTSISTAHCT